MLFYSVILIKKGDNMEYIELYDIDRKNLNKKLDRASSLPKGRYRVVIHICLMNSKGEMLIQQRDKSKKNFPLTWDITLGGGVQSGENSRQAAKRELFEELGIEYDFTATRPAFTINFADGFDDYYIIKKDVDIKDVKFNDGEVQACKWASKDEIIEMINSGRFIKYHIPLIELIFCFKDNVNAFNV